MAYYITPTRYELRLLSANAEEAIGALRRSRPDVPRGTIAAVQSFGFENFRQQGEFCYLDLPGVNTRWDEQHEALIVLASFLEPGCFVEWRDEQTNAAWRDVFDGCAFRTIEPIITWSER